MACAAVQRPSRTSSATKVRRLTVALTVFGTVSFQANVAQAMAVSDRTLQPLNLPEQSLPEQSLLLQLLSRLT